jgi:hypothetical protein
VTASRVVTHPHSSPARWLVVLAGYCPLIHAALPATCFNRRPTLTLPLWIDVSAHQTLRLCASLLAFIVSSPLFDIRTFHLCQSPSSSPPVTSYPFRGKVGAVRQFSFCVDEGGRPRLVSAPEIHCMLKSSLLPIDPAALLAGGVLLWQRSGRPIFVVSTRRRHRQEQTIKVWWSYQCHSCNRVPSPGSCCIRSVCVFAAE